MNIRPEIETRKTNMRKQYHFRKVGSDTYIWDVLKLAKQAQDLKVTEISLESIAEIDEIYWYELGGASPTCRNISEHAKLILDADLDYPILLCHEGRVMDGMHRVCKAIMLGKEWIRAKQFSLPISPDFINVDESELPY